MAKQLIEEYGTADTDTSKLTILEAEIIKAGYRLMDVIDRCFSYDSGYRGTVDQI